MQRDRLWAGSRQRHCESNKEKERENTTGSEQEEEARGKIKRLPEQTCNRSSEGLGCAETSWYKQDGKLQDSAGVGVLTGTSAVQT